jgi:uncharacterized protein YecA (UPF0149 family)
MENIKPLKKTDPLIAELFMAVANQQYDKFNVRQILMTTNQVVLFPYKSYHLRRNDRCLCGSGKKWKYCDCFPYHL